MQTLAEQEIKNFVETALSQWKNVVLFYALRLMIAPLIEAVLLCDRKFYLEENGLRSIMVPAFEPAVSSRNIALICWK